MLNYDVNAEASRAGLRSLLYWAIREMENEIELGMIRRELLSQGPVYPKSIGPR